MQHCGISLRDQDCLGRGPAFQGNDTTAFITGAWAGVCFALALLSAATVLLVRAPEVPKTAEQALAPTITVPSRN